jgi:peptide deformylase
MSLLNVLKYPNKKLLEKSKALKEVSKSIQDLVRDMFETMYLEDGIGLAAPQIGENIRVIVVDVAKKDKDDPEIREPDPVALINPQIISSEGLIEFEESCLSCPDLAVWVDRKEKIKVGYWDTEGKPCELTAEGLKSVCIQHEIDHLNGILLVDKVSRFERDMYKKKRVRVLKEEKELETVLF